MPKTEYGKNVQRIKELKKELENIKVERMNAFLNGDTAKVEFWTQNMKDITEELEKLNVVG